MSEGERIRRPEPERMRPIRSWSSLYSSPASSVGAPPPGTTTADGGDGDTRPAASDSVARAVGLGYRVVEEYIRQGQNAARMFGESSYGPYMMPNDLQEVTTRMLEYSSRMAELWMQFFVGAAASGAPTGRGPDVPNTDSSPPPEPAATPDAGEAHVRVSIAMDADRPTETSVDLRPVAHWTSLTVSDLREADPAKPRLTGVRIEPGSAPDAWTLCIRVTSQQPPGVYNGLIIDRDTSVPAGTVSVRILPGAESRE